MTAEAVYKNKRRLMLYMAQKYVGYTIAEDIVQNAFYKLLCKYGNEDVPNLDSILFTIVLNESKNHIAHKKIVEKYNDHLRVNIEEYELMNIEFDYVSMIYKKLDNLPTKCRRIFELYYFEDLTAPEIAKTLGIKTTSVTSQLQRGRDLLRPYLTETKQPPRMEAAVVMGSIRT